MARVEAIQRGTGRECLIWSFGFSINRGLCNFQFHLPSQPKDAGDYVLYRKYLSSHLQEPRKAAQLHYAGFVGGPQGHGDGPVAVSGAGSWCQLHTNEESAPFPQTPQADSVRGGMHVFGSSRVTAMRVHSLPTVIHSPNTPKLAGVQARCQALQERGSTVAELAFMVRESWRLGPALVGGQGEKQTEIAHSWLASDSPKHSSRVFGNQGASSIQDG